MEPRRLAVAEPLVPSRETAVMAIIEFLKGALRNAPPALGRP
jgi:hypothetical protein